MGNGLARELQEVKPASPVTLPSRDVRAGSSPFLGGILRFETLRRGGRVVALAALDVAGMFLAIYTALLIKTLVRSPDVVERTFGQAKDVAPLACLVMLLLFARSGLYRDRAQRPGFTTVASSLFQVTVVIALYAVIEGFEFSSYYIFYGSLFFALIYVMAFRWIFERVSGAVLHAAGYRRRAVLVGSGSHVDAVAHALRDNSTVEPFGYVSLSTRSSEALRDFGSLQALERHFDAIDEVLIADPEFPQDQAVELVDRCHQHGIRVRVAPSTMEILMDRVEFVPGQSLPLFELKPPVFEGIDFVVKRVFDLLGASLLLLFLSPVLAVIAIAIKIDSRGPVLYRSRRPGIGGHGFACLKFRTMEHGAEALQDTLEEHNEKAGALFKIREDPRVTTVGAFLRRYSLDELPQLVNVLRGEMSLVGPRPLTMRDYEKLEDWHRKRYLVLPGLTGLWQVSGRSLLSYEVRVELDVRYARKCSLRTDVGILLRTIPSVLRGVGAF